MVETESITTRIEVNSDGVKAGLSTAKTELGTFEKGAADTATKVDASTKKMGKGFADLGVSMSGLALGAFSLYQTYDNIEKKEYALEKSKQSVEKASLRAQKAQADYNQALKEFGAGAPETVAAYQELEIANEDVRLAEEKADQAQGNLNEQMMQAALITVPALVTTSKGLVDVWKQFQGIDFKKTFASMKEGLQSLGTKNSGVMGSAIAAAGAFAMIYMAFTTDSPKLKAAYSILAGALIAAAAAQWIMNAAAAFGLSLTVAGIAVVAVAAAAAAGIFLLSSKYGADADKYGGEARSGLDNPGAMAAGGASTAPTGAYGGTSASGGMAKAKEPKFQGYDQSGRAMYDIEGFSTWGWEAVMEDAYTGKMMYTYTGAKAQAGKTLDEKYAEANSGLPTTTGPKVVNNTTIYVDGAADAQRTADTISKTLQTQGGMGY